MRTATRVFGRDGFQGASMRKIAGELDISAPALYYHFENKQALAWAIIESGLDRYRAACGPALEASDDPVEQIRAHVEAHTRHAYAHRDFVQMMDLFFISVGQAPMDIHGGVRTMARNVLSPEHAERFAAEASEYLGHIADVLRKGNEQGCFTIDHLELATAGVIVLPDHAIRWVQPGAVVGVDEIAAQQARLVLRMLGAQVV